MAWVRIDDQIGRNVKLLQAGPAASWLWLLGLAHCQSQLTDGFISDLVLPLLGITHHAPTLAKKLAAARLWERVEGGYRIHDYFDFNESRAVILERRASLAATRAAAGRAGGIQSGISRLTLGADDDQSTSRKHLDDKLPTSRKHGGEANLKQVASIRSVIQTRTSDETHTKPEGNRQQPKATLIRPDSSRVQADDTKPKQVASRLLPTVRTPIPYKDQEQVLSTPLFLSPQPKTETASARFARWWALYPKKVGKAAAWRAWQRIKPDEGRLDGMLATLKVQIASKAWRQEGGRFIPAPAKWLRDGHADDELQPDAEAEPTRAELADAKRLRDAVMGCRHEPRCETYAACLHEIVLAMRRRSEDGESA